MLVENEDTPITSPRPVGPKCDNMLQRSTFRPYGTMSWGGFRFFTNILSLTGHKKQNAKNFIQMFDFLPLSLRGRTVHPAPLHSVRKGSLGRKGGYDAGLGRENKNMAQKYGKFIKLPYVCAKNGVKTTANFETSGDFVPEKQNNRYKTTANLNKSSIFVPKMGSKQPLILKQAVILYPINRNMTSELKILFEKNHGYLAKKELQKKSTYKNVLRLVAKGEAERVKRGVYRLCDYEMETMIDLNRVVPNGVLCLYSALFHYNLTVQIPQAFCVAIEKNRKVTLPDYPPIQLYFWKQEYYELGITTEKIYDFDVKIYDIEKSVCDAVKFRNKIGIDVTAEVLKNYLQRQDRNLTKLLNYARQMRIEKTLRTYLEVEL
jgi:predicted transcriptional regulator of viral defense system